MRAKHFEAVFTPISSSFHHNFIIGFNNFIIGFIIGFVIITHRAAEFFFADWDSGCNDSLIIYLAVVAVPIYLCVIILLLYTNISLYRQLFLSTCMLQL